MLLEERTLSSSHTPCFVLNHRLDTVLGRVGRCRAGCLHSAPLRCEPVSLHHWASQSPTAAVVAIRQIRYFSVPEVLNVPSKNLACIVQ